MPNSDMESKIWLKRGNIYQHPFSPNPWYRIILHSFYDIANVHKQHIWTYMNIYGHLQNYDVWISDDTTYLIHSFNQPIEIDQAPQQEPKQPNPCKSGIYTQPIFTICYLLASNFILTFYYLQMRCSFNQCSQGVPSRGVKKKCCLVPLSEPCEGISGSRKN